MDASYLKRVYYELFAGALGMEPDCKMSLHRYYTHTPAEPLGVRELVSRGAASVTFDESSCRTYHTDVVFRWYVFFRGVLIYLVE